MARLRQLNPQNYPSSTNINAEFENIVRYLNSAELGNKTVSELLDVLFDDAGVFDGPIEMRRLSGTGIQFRVGEFTDAEAGWITLISDTDLRGASGVDLGSIGAPIFHSRQDTTATAGQTVISYSHASTDTLVVYKNGLLQVPTTDYTSSDSANTVTMTSALAANDKISIFKVRASVISGFVRADVTITATSQVVHSFTHTEEQVLQVWLNGVLLQEGGSNDYTTNPASNTITLVNNPSVNDKLTIITVENTSNQVVTGLMLEGNFTDTADGLIKFAKINIADNAITQAKVSGLTAALTAATTMTISASTPSSPAQGDLFLDTSTSPNQLKFFDGVQFISLNAEAEIPTFASSNANQFLKVNGTGTALQFSAVDLSSVVPQTFMGAANGVASLDSSALVPSAQLPTILTAISLPAAVGGSVSNGTVLVQRLFKQKLRIDGITHALSAGSCTVQISVDGSVVGSTHAVSTSGTDTTISPAISIDASTGSKRLEIVVTGVSGATDLEVGIACVTEDT